MSNLRENLRIRRLRQDIAATQAEIDAIDLEEAAKAKRIFEEKYNIEKQKETQLQGSVRMDIYLLLLSFLLTIPQYAHIGGEISSLQAQLDTLQSDMKDFDNIAKKYRDQLIKVKVRSYICLLSTVLTYSTCRCRIWPTLTLRNTPRP